MKKGIKEKRKKIVVRSGVFDLWNMIITIPYATIDKNAVLNQAMFRIRFPY